MGYESAWLNGNIPCAVSNLKSIGGIYIAGISAVDRIADTAAGELANMLKEMFGTAPEICYISALHELPQTDSEFNILLEKVSCETSDKLAVDGSYCISPHAESRVINVSAASATGILYGVFRLITLLKTVDSFEKLEVSASPASPLRMLNHWDNMDGSIERGYSGQSFFFKDNKVIIDDRTEAYARLVASVGINAVVINNVNVRAAATKLIAAEYRAEVKQLADIFGRYGIDLYLSLNFAAPIELGGLDTCDPLNEEVTVWWKETLDDLFTDVKGLKGFLIKADSEGRPGPFTYGRNHAEGANMLADIIAPYGGLIIWRCFVYNCKQDWRDTVTDRAKAQYDNFMPLDGMFRDNVILQIKNGPMDFQVREPVSPLFGGLKQTNSIIEFQIAQEYTGQQKHVCFLIPEFKEILEFRTYIRDKDGNPCEADTICDIVTGRTFGNKLCGMTAVTNTGDDENWTGHDLAAANLYGFGRLCFEPELTCEQIEREWITLTFGKNETVYDRISYILDASWPAYEKYTAPLGVGWMVNPGHHYGPNVDGYEFSEWGTYHRSDAQGMGVERGPEGTGYTLQYNEPNASMYADLKTCPDNLILFMHHVPYTYMLHSGKTVIRHIYDTHHEGVKDALSMLEAWKSLKGLVDDRIYERTLKRFEIQAESAKEWCDAICTYYSNKSGILDEKEGV